VRHTSPYSPPFSFLPSLPLLPFSPLTSTISYMTSPYKLHAAATRPLRLLILHICVNIRACGLARPKRRRVQCRRSKTAVCGHSAARSAYGWQCDMIGIPAVRHSNTEPVKRTNRPIFIYRFPIIHIIKCFAEIYKTSKDVTTMACITNRLLFTAVQCTSLLSNQT